MNAVLWAALAACIWGIAPLIEKLGLSGTPPVIGVFARSLGVVAAVLIFGALWSPWKALGEVSLRSFLLLAFGGFLASFVGQMAFYQALKHGPISQVTPVSGTYPLIAALLGWVILREPFTALRAIGVLLVVAGVSLLRH